MAHNLKNSDYDDHNFLVEQIAKESPIFNSYIQGMLKDVDSKFPTNEVWLGTLQLGKEKVPTQIKLMISQESKHFIDEND